MDQWQLVDCLEPLEQDADNPTIALRSETHLREELERLRHRKHGLIGVKSPDQDLLAISIGGPFASFG